MQNPFYTVTRHLSAAHSETVHHSFSAASLSSGAGLHTPFPCSNVGSTPQDTVLHELVQCVSFPRALVLHNLPYHRSLPGCIPSGTGCSSGSPHVVTSLASQCAPVWTPLSMSPQLLPGTYTSTGFPWRLSFLQCRALHRLQEDLCSD